MTYRRLLPSLLLLVALLLAGCKKQSSTQINYQMGERIVAGPMVYNEIGRAHV